MIAYTTRLSIVFYLVIIMISACSRQPVYPPPATSDDEAVFDISTLVSEAPQFFTYRYQGRNINFFVMRTGEKILSFLDACASCYPHKRGFKYDKSAVVCRSCDIRFPVSKLENGLGGCYPIKIAGRTENGKYFIPLASLQAEEGKF